MQSAYAQAGRPAGTLGLGVCRSIYSLSRSLCVRLMGRCRQSASGKHVSLDATANSQGGNYVDGNTRTRRSLARCDYNSCCYCRRRRRRRRFTKPRIKSGAADFRPQKRYAQQTTICFCSNETAIKTTAMKFHHGVQEFVTRCCNISCCACSGLCLIQIHMIY